jgi:hypothetical protein
MPLRFQRRIRSGRRERERLSDFPEVGFSILLISEADPVDFWWLLSF